jgi:hypothetical protein
VSTAEAESAEGDPEFLEMPLLPTAPTEQDRQTRLPHRSRLQVEVLNSLPLLIIHPLTSYNGMSPLNVHCLPLTRTGPPHNNTSRLLWRPHNRSRRLRVVSSSRRFAEICSCQPRQWRQWWRLLIFEHHHGRSLPNPERWPRKDGQHRTRGCHRTIQETV